MKKNYAFIDSQNLNLGVLSQGWKLDFKKFRKLLKDKYFVAKAFLFIGFIPKNKNLYSRLERDGYLLVFKPVLESKIKGQIKIKGNVDAELVLHTMIEFGNYNKAVIVSGDGDFYCLIEYFDYKKKLLHLFTPNKFYSRLFKPFSGYIVQVDWLKNSLEYKKKTGISGRSKP